MLNGLKMLSRVTLLLAVLCASGLIATGQSSLETFRKLLTDKAAFTESELSVLDNGEMVVKMLQARDKREVAVFGIVRVQNVPDMDISSFRDSLSQKANKVMLGGGVFSNPPVLQDLGSVKIEDRDIEDIKKCVVGDCNVKLSAAMIKRLHAEVDWDAADYKLQAANVFRQMLVDYARDYLARGDAALVEYVDQKKPVRLAEEYRILLDGSVFIRGLAPEFDNYLRKFPGVELPGTENRLDWSKVSSGLKPITTITHGAAFSKRTNEDSVLMIATKQIYSSHYVDASLALSSLVRIRSNEAADSYLIFTNTSRSNALAGAFSRMAHAVVEKEARDKVQDLLQRAKLRLEAKTRNQAEPANETDEAGLLSRIAEISGNAVFRVLAILVLAAIIILLFRRWRT